MIYVAADKHGYEVIKLVEAYLESKKYEYENLGVKNKEEDLKLEEMLPRVANKVRKDKQNIGIVSCGTGIGVEVGINKSSGIRGSLVTDEKMAGWSRIYDNCNVICLVGWDFDQKKVYKILDAYFAAEYDGSEKRLKMFEEFNKWH